MKPILTLVAAAAITICCSFTPKKSIVVTSYAFTDNNYIPVKYTCLGQSASPPLTFGNIPAETKSLAIVVDDPDYSYTCKVASQQPKGRHKGRKALPAKMVKMDSCFVNWVIWNIDTGSFIPENFKNDNEGINGLRQVGYTGLCPASGLHHYHFKVYALDIRLNLARTGGKKELERLMQGHVLAWGEIVGLFDKNYR